MTTPKPGKSKIQQTKVSHHSVIHNLNFGNKIFKYIILVYVLLYT